MGWQPKDEDGVKLKSGDHITFTFGIPPICVTARITERDGSWTVECLHPTDVKPKLTTLKELMQYSQIWKASRHRVDAVLRTMRTQTEPPK